MRAAGLASIPETSKVPSSADQPTERSSNTGRRPGRMMFLRVSRGAAMWLGMMLLVCVSASVSAHESEETSSELVNYLIVSSEYNDEPACRTNKGEGDFESAFYPVELPRNECFELCDELKSCVSLSVFTQREETACMLYFKKENVPSVLPKLHGIASVVDESYREVSPKEFYYESSEGFDLAACYKKLPHVPKKRLRHRSRRSKTDSETS